MERPLHRAMALAALAALPLGGCAGDADLLRQAGLAPGPGPKPLVAPDFVVASRRPGSLDYMPVGVSAPARPLRKMTEARRKDLEAELEGVRRGNEARGRAAAGVAKGVGKGVGKGLDAPRVPPPTE